ncbi:MAG: penicillin-binding protein 2 [Rhodothermales bacterium]
MEEHRLRVRIIVGSMLLMLLVLGIRLAQLQLVDANAYSGETQSIAVREKRVIPARGAIMDRNGLLMVDNEFTYTITITPRFFDESQIGLLAELLGVPDSTVQNRLREARAWSAFRPSPAFREVPFEVFSRLQENAHRLPGVWYDEEQKRRYLTPAHATHVLGYTREITRTELERRINSDYRQGDLIGKSGLEKSYEPMLRGDLGSELKLVNVHGLEVGGFREGAADLHPTSGYDLHLALDSRLQAFAESLFVNKRGAVVALDPNNGEILSMVSMPDLDPDVFARSMSAAEWQGLTASESTPLFNRATMSMMPPGSTWKPFMALMALQEGLITPDQKVYCAGGHPIGRGLRFKCLGVHGYVDVSTAILKSCNTFFFEMMRRADVNTFRRYANEFGFGTLVPSDIAEQTVGLIPDSAYYNRVYPRGWTVGYSMNLGIGQGDMGVTAMQLARYAATLATRGTVPVPHLVRYLHHPETDSTIVPPLEPTHRVPVDSAYFDIVRNSMHQLMEIGSGLYFKIPGISSAGKTGTAQAPGDQKSHSLFIMFAPFDAPKIAIAVIVENAGAGATQAGPIASLMAEHYLKGRVTPSPGRRWLMQRLVNDLHSEDL